eukprot:m.121186 g.121186  ORF g.121186 m.121186 type:complete len:135 (+) comp11076_c0_seq1:570-974(+)
MAPPVAMGRVEFDEIMERALVTGGGRGVWTTREAADSFDGVREMKVGGGGGTDGSWNGRDEGPGYERGLEGQAGGGWIPRDEDMFISGGFHRGDALAHVARADRRKMAESATVTGAAAGWRTAAPPTAPGGSNG